MSFLGNAINKEKIKIRLIYIFVLSIVIVTSIINLKSGDIEYFDSDATWHTMLTIQAYKETPITEHKFLPIVSLGKDSDKHISWGATVVGENGNYYYTSFSPAGYFLPYIFIQIFNLPVAEESLYIFNSILLIISTLIMLTLILDIFKESKWKYLLGFLTSCIFVFQPEIMHGMGLVYWHQSVMQVTLLLQIYFYYIYRNYNSKKAKTFFYIMCVINPYIEWTGYVANIGFALAECINKRKNLKKALFAAINIGILTMLSFSLFVIHYISVVNVKLFLVALKNRFLARNFATSTSIISLIKGYGRSLYYTCFLLVVIGFMVIFVKKEKLCEKSYLLNHKWLILVTIFPVIENLIMKQHAVSYSYDRMKIIFIICLVFSDILHILLESFSNYFIKSIVLILTIISCLGNLYIYNTSQWYIWEAPYMEQNRIIANYLNERYPEAIYGTTNNSVRGYINLVLHRGVYEWKDIDTLLSIAQREGKREVVVIKQDDNYNTGIKHVPNATAGLTNWQAIVYDSKEMKCNEIVRTNRENMIILED